MSTRKFLFGAVCRCRWCGAAVQFGCFEGLKPGAMGLLHSEPKCTEHEEHMRKMAAGTFTLNEIVGASLKPFTAIEAAQARAMRAWSKRRPLAGP